jgi:VanZ family protein
MGIFDRLRADVRAWRLIFVLGVIASLVLALAPASGGSEPFAHFDKVKHMAGFAALWIVGVLAGLRPGWALALGLVVFGVGIELAQSFTISRHASKGDVLADMLGVGLGMFITTVTQVRRHAPATADSRSGGTSTL